MSDYNSSLPVRTENAGDVIVRLGDGTTPSQQASVDASGRLLSRITDTAGNSLTSTGGALDVNITNSISVGVADKTAFTYGTSTEQTIGGVYQDTSPTLTAGQQGAARLTEYRGFHVNLRTAAGVELIGQEASADSIPVVLASDQSAIPVTQSGTWTVQPGNTANTTPWLVTDSSDGPVSPGTAAAFSSLAGLVFNSSAPTLTNGQQAALQGDSAANLLVKVNAALPAGSNVIGAVTQSGTWTVAQGTAAAVSGAWPILVTDGTDTAAIVPASTAANATDPALVVALSPNSPLPTGTNNIGNVGILIGGTANSPSNPLYVNNVDAAGTPVDSYQTSAALAANASVNLDYTVTAATTFYGQQVWAAASGKMKVEVKFETSAGSGTYNTFWVGFNSTANPNVLIPMSSTKTQVAGAKVRVTITNLDNQAQDVYKTLTGTEVA